MAAGDVIRLAMVGFGRIAPKHLEVFRALGARVEACCNRSEAGRHKAKSNGGILRTYSSIDEMIRLERPEGIICCASVEGMYEAAKSILPYGIPTLLEKPPATSWSEYRRLCEIQQQFQTPTMIGLNRRWYSVIRQAIEDAGGRTRVTGVFVEWSEDPTRLLERGLSLETISRMVFGNSLHGLDLVVFLAGDIPSPQIVVANHGEPKRWVMALNGVSARGAIVSFSSTWDSPCRWRVSFTSPGKRYVFAPLESCDIHEAGTQNIRKILPAEEDDQFKPGFYAQARRFLEIVRCGTSSPSDDLNSAGPAMQLAERLTAACESVAPRDDQVRS